VIPVGLDGMKEKQRPTIVTPKQQAMAALPVAALTTMTPSSKGSLASFGSPGMQFGARTKMKED
jgi:hypothetical protein